MGLYETLPYDVIESHGAIELRRYNDFLLASTKTTPNRRGDSGFSNVFRYISGQNDQQAKISMTTPVVTYEEDGGLVTGFYVPSKFDKNTVPAPSSNNVFIDEHDKSLYMVIRFRGRWDKSNYDKHDALLRAFIDDSKYAIASKRLVFRYQPPMIPGIFRRNEIAYKLTTQ